MGIPSGLKKRTRAISKSCTNPSISIHERKPNPMPDRKALNDIVSDILGLTHGQRDAVYEAVVELVKNRRS